MPLISPEVPKLPRRVLVCGGRDFVDKDWLFETLDAHHAAEPFACVIEGGQVSVDPKEKGLPWEKRKKWGADYFARMWAYSRGLSVYTVKAEWKRLGRGAGPIRNQRMIDEYHPTECMAFPGGRGTADMLAKAKAAGLDWMKFSRSPAPNPGSPSPVSHEPSNGRG